MNFSFSEDGTIFQNQISLKKKKKKENVKDLQKTSSVALTVTHPWLQFGQSEPLPGPESKSKAFHYKGRIPFYREKYCI